jgi:hypothetical protein
VSAPVPDAGAGTEWVAPVADPALATDDTDHSNVQGPAPTFTTTTSTFTEGSTPPKTT